MAKTVEIKISQFSGGIGDSLRSNSPTEFGVAKMFDVFSNPNLLIPYRSLVTDSTNAVAGDMKQYKIKDFVYSSTSNKLYGLGQTSIGLTKILFKENATTGNWSIPATSEGNGAVQNGCFVEFKDYMWGFQGTNQIFKWGLLSGTPAITNSAATVGATITSVANGVINSLGDLYIAYNNVLVRIAPDATTITDSAKTVPANYKITSMCNWGNYLAVGCSPVSTFNGVSKVFLWDYSSTEKFQEVIDWGEGELRVLETIEGYLVGVTDRYLNNITGAGKGSMIIQTWSGGIPQVAKEIFTTALTGQPIPTSKVIRNNRLFWDAKIMTTDGYLEGIWSFGRKNANYPFAINLDIIDENVNTGGIQSFGNAANYFFISYNGDGSIDKTAETDSHTFTSVYESLIFDFGDPDVDKRLENVNVSFPAITTGQSLTVKYRVDDGSWVTIGTYNTVGKKSRNFINIESTGAGFASGNEYEFRLESTGGLKITGLKIKATILNTP
jgi:hypothetical protein